MPLIAEMKYIEGELWCRLTEAMNELKSPIHIYSDEEIKAVRKDERKLVIEMIKELDHAS